jgi:hypothetical protein
LITEQVTDMPSQSEQNTDFEKAAQGNRANLVTEFWGFMAENKKWWMFPVIATMLMVGALVFIGGSGAAPFIYTLF